VGLVVADVCGKGVGAALFMALFRSLTRVLLAQRWEATGRNAEAALVEAATAVNDYIGETHGDAHMFATAFIAVLDPETGALTFVNAGHDAPVVLDADGGSGERLHPTGPALGLLPGVGFTPGGREVRPGETLVCFTDGVSDARGPQGPLGEERLLELLRAPSVSAAALLERIKDEIAMYCQGLEPFDDVTLLAVRRRS
jgi:phosphoserine phosphatase RsbU/P